MNGPTLADRSGTGTAPVTTAPEGRIASTMSGDPYMPPTPSTWMNYLSSNFPGAYSATYGEGSNPFLPPGVGPTNAGTYEPPTIESLAQALYGQLYTPGADPRLGLLGLDNVYASQAYNEDILRQQHGLDLARLGLQGQSIANQRGSLGGRLADIGQLEGIAQARFGLTEKDREILFGAINRRRETAGLEQDWKLQSNLSESIAKGTPFSAGKRRRDAQIKRGYEDTLDTLAREYGTALVGRERDRLGLAEQMVNFGASRRNVAESGQGLNIAAQSLGIDRQELELGLRTGLENLGFTAQGQIDSIMQGVIDGLNSDQADQNIAAQTAMAMALTIQPAIQSNPQMQAWIEQILGPGYGGSTPTRPGAFTLPNATSRYGS